MNVAQIEIEISRLRKSLTAIKDRETCNKVIDNIVMLTIDKEKMIDENRKKVSK